MTNRPDDGSAPPAPKRPVTIVDYDPTWPQAFAEARAEILEAVGPYVECVEHVGSTSVEGLAAKPIIDTQVGVKDWHEARVTIKPLRARGWLFRGQNGIPRRHYFVKRNAAGRRTHHLHMLEVSSDRWHGALDFRDYLRAHSDAACEYAALKRRLARRIYRDAGEYTEAKAPFIQRILAQALGKSR